MIRIISTGSLLIILALPVLAQETPLTVTIYNQDLGIVKEIRSLELTEGLGDIRITDVPSRIDATSVKFKSLLDPLGTTVVEQNYVFDLASEAKLLERFLDKMIGVITEDGTLYSGRLIAGPQNPNVNPNQGWQPAPAASNLTLVQDNGQVVIVQRDKIRDIQLPELPDGLLTKPTLVWKVFTKKPGKHDCQIMYMTTGMSWNADYNMVIADKEAKTIDLTGWVTLNNTSGKTYPQAKVKLIAGDVHRVQPPALAMEGFMMMDAMPAAMAAPPQVTERELFEYHLYELGHRTDVLDNQTKQVEFITANDVPAEKFFVYDGVGPGIPWYGNREAPDYGIPTNTKVQVYVEFMNKESNNLGKPLPAGKIRLFQKDAGQDFEFIGEDSIDHTPKDERVRLRVGNSFDIVGDRRQTDFKVISSCVVEESFEIKVRNHKKEPVEVRVVEHLYRWSEWELIEQSQTFEKLDAKTMETRVTVPQGEQGITLTYKVRYKWC